MAEGGSGECYKALLLTTMELCRTMAVINAGLPRQDTEDTLEHREQRAYDMLHTRALPQVKQAKESLVVSVKSVCSLLPNYFVPLFALFRMCDNICSIYGWGKRKHKTKRCAGALKELAGELQELLTKMLSALSR